MHVGLDEARHKGAPLEIYHLGGLTGVRLHDIGGLSEREDVAVSHGECRDLRLLLVHGYYRAAVEYCVCDVRLWLHRTSSHWHHARQNQSL